MAGVAKVNAALPTCVGIHADITAPYLTELGTAIGDTVNLGSRIEGTTKGVARVLVSEATRAACDPARFRFEHRGQFHVKGREKPVDLYEPSMHPQETAGGSP